MLECSRDACLGSREFASYLAGAVFGSEKVRIRRHLKKCNPCFELYITTFNQSFEDWQMPAPAAAAAHPFPAARRSALRPHP